MLREKTHRRGFLGRLAAAAAAASLPWTELGAASTTQAAGHDDWLDDVKGSHTCFFDFPAHKMGAGLVHIRNYILTYKEAYGVGAEDIGTVGTFYSVGPQSSISMAFNDEMWAKYGLGAYLNIDDPGTGRPVTRNLFNHPQEGDPVPFVGPIGPFPDAGIESMQQNMGTTFLLCANAVTAFSMDLARLGKGAADEVRADLAANVLPGVVTVPAMVIAIEKAQVAGISYNTQ